MQSLHSDRDHAQGLAWLAELPARDGDHPVGFQVLEISSKRLHGIKTVLAQGKSSSGGRGPGIDQSHLNHVEILFRIADKRPSVSDLDVNLGPLVQVIRIIGVAPPHYGIGDDWINLNSRHAWASIGDGAKYIHSAARPDDCVLPMRPQN